MAAKANIEVALLREMQLIATTEVTYIDLPPHSNAGRWQGGATMGRPARSGLARSPLRSSSGKTLSFEADPQAGVVRLDESEGEDSVLRVSAGGVFRSAVRRELHVDADNFVS